MADHQQHDPPATTTTIPDPATTTIPDSLNPIINTTAIDSGTDSIATDGSKISEEDKGDSTTTEKVQTKEHAKKNESTSNGSTRAGQDRRIVCAETPGFSRGVS